MKKKQDKSTISNSSHTDLKMTGWQGGEGKREGGYNFFLLFFFIFSFSFFFLVYSKSYHDITQVLYIQECTVIKQEQNKFRTILL